MTRRTLAFASFLLAGCSSEVAPIEASDVEPGQTLSDLSDPPTQCSRETVARGDSYFMPDSRDIAAFEAKLDAGLRSGELNGGEPYFDMLTSTHNHGPNLTISRDWVRSYVGINRDGRRMLYGDFQPANDRGEGHVFVGIWQTAEVCDGGPAEFGAEMDLRTGKVSIIGFAGSV